VLQNRKIKVVLVSLLTVLVLYSGNLILNAGAYLFEAPMLGFYFVKAEYHAVMNDYFNDKITLLLATKTDDPNYSPPEEDQPCGDENVSTYCVAMGALDRYDAYVATLDSVMGHFGPTDGDIKILMPGGLVGDLNPAQLLGLTSSRNASIVNEKKYALDLMDMAIGAYNEFRTAYPMHLKYDDVIVELTKYREALEEVRVDIAKMPPKFRDSTSSSCK